MRRRNGERDMSGYDERKYGVRFEKESRFLKGRVNVMTGNALYDVALSLSSVIVLRKFLFLSLFRTRRCLRTQPC